MLLTGKRDKKTATQIIIYTVWTVVSSLIPVFGVTGKLYVTPVSGVLILLLGGFLLRYAIRLYKTRDAKTAKQLFQYYCLHVYYAVL